MQKIFAWLVLRVGSNLLLDPTLNTSPKPHLQKVLPCGHPCHTWDLGLGTLCEVVSTNVHALNIKYYIDWPQVTWDPQLFYLTFELPYELNSFGDLISLTQAGTLSPTILAELNTQIHTCNKHVPPLGYLFCMPYELIWTLLYAYILFLNRYVKKWFVLIRCMGLKWLIFHVC